MERYAYARHKINEYINQCGYTYSVDDIMNIYKKYYIHNRYISFTADKVISANKRYLEILMELENK